ncbi:ABC transporter ATP-binding protein [Patescibacteria group bacterium]|nr:ABC transporter ATP-binding protein [Patescibacteria group bacterium]
MPIIEVNNLVKHFGQVKAVDDISFSVEKGEIFGFLGPNGAGKTTTIRCLMDFIRPTTGEIKILGKDAQKNTVKVKEDIGYLSGNVRLYDKWTGQAHLNFLRKLNGHKEDHSTELIKRFDFDPSRKTKELSSGNRQKLGIIMAFMFYPKVLICDEPTNALDPLLQNEVYELLQEASKREVTVFMSSHNLAEVEKVCERVAVIKEGKMAATESIISLKQKKIYSVHAHFADKFDPADFQGNGLKIVRQLNNSLMLKVKGDIDQVVKKLSQYKLVDLEIDQASLEDIFLEFYE